MCLITFVLVGMQCAFSLTRVQTFNIISKNTSSGTVLDLPQVDLMKFRINLLGHEAAVFKVAKRPSERRINKTKDFEKV